jgi:hypothetical protein
MRILTKWSAVTFVLAALGCGGAGKSAPSRPVDAGPDARVDGNKPADDAGEEPADAGGHPALDAGVDADVSGAVEAGTDVQSDAGPLSCTAAADCGDPTVYECVEQSCRPRRTPTGWWVSNGGQTLRSGTHLMRVSFGGPQPMRRLKSQGHTVTVGPLLVRP